MRFLHRNVLVYGIFFLAISCKVRLPNENNCIIKSTEKCFLFEKSSSITIIDDMVLRNAALVSTSNCLIPEYSKGMYVFGGDMIIEKDAFKLCKNQEQLYNVSQESINENEKRQLLRSLRNYQGKAVVYSKHIYTAAYVKLDYIYLGKFKMNFNENEKIVPRIVPVFLILKIHSIDGKQLG